MASFVTSIKDAANPFVRLVANVIIDDGNPNVPFFQMEEIKEATFQSEYACDSIHKALAARLEWRGYPIQISKTLGVFRMLMLEGPASFNNKMGSVAGKFLQITTESVDVRRGSVEERNRDLAAAIHSAISGDSKQLVRFSTEAAQITPTVGQATSAGGKVLTYKSDFQAQQEREAKAYKKRLEEEKSKSSLVVNDRLYDTFDGTNGPIKLVEAAMNSPKKKFAREELDSFVQASLHTEKVNDVCAALDSVLRDGKQALQNRYKALTIIEALTVHHQVFEAMVYFKGHMLGLQRHLTIERIDNPAKAEAAKAISQGIVATVQQVQVNVVTPAGRARSGTQTGAQPPQTNVGAATAKQQHPSHEGHGGWEWNGPNQAPSSSSFDNMFSNLSIKQPQQVQVQPSQQRAQQAPPPAQTSQQWDFWSQPSSAPQQRQQATTTTPSLSSGSFGLPPAPNSSFVNLAPVSHPQTLPVHTQHPVFGSSSAPAVPSGPPPPSTQEDLIRRQMEEFQRNMQLMMQLVQQQQQHQHHSASPAAPTVPATQALPPPQPVEVPRQPDVTNRPPSMQREDSEQSNAHQHEVVEAHEQPMPPPPVVETIHEALRRHEDPVPSNITPVLHTQASAPLPPPPSAPQVVAPPAVAIPAGLEMLAQLQQQMMATQQMLAQQQAAFQMLQAQLLGQQPPHQ